MRESWVIEQSGRGAAHMPPVQLGRFAARSCCNPVGPRSCLMNLIRALRGTGMAGGLRFRQASRRRRHRRVAAAADTAGDDATTPSPPSQDNMPTKHSFEAVHKCRRERENVCMRARQAARHARGIVLGNRSELGVALGSRGGGGGIFRSAANAILPEQRPPVCVCVCMAAADQQQDLEFLGGSSLTRSDAGGCLRPAAAGPSRRPPPAAASLGSLPDTNSVLRGPASTWERWAAGAIGAVQAHPLDIGRLRPSRCPKFTRSDYQSLWERRQPRRRAPNSTSPALPRGTVRQHALPLRPQRLNIVFAASQPSSDIPGARSSPRQPLPAPSREGSSAWPEAPPAMRPSLLLPLLLLGAALAAAARPERSAAAPRALRLQPVPRSGAAWPAIPLLPGF